MTDREIKPLMVEWARDYLLESGIKVSEFDVRCALENALRAAATPQQPASEDTITPAELWAAIDGNPGIKPSKQEALDAARCCAEASDERYEEDRLPTPAQSEDAGAVVRRDDPDMEPPTVLGYGDEGPIYGYDADDMADFANKKLATQPARQEVVSEYIAARDAYEEATRPTNSHAMPRRLPHGDPITMRYRAARVALAAASGEKK